MREVWTSDEVLLDITEQLHKQHENYQKDLSKLNHQVIIARTALKKYACEDNWKRQNKSESIYKGYGLKKAQAALKAMNKIHRGKDDNNNT